MIAIEVAPGLTLLVAPPPGAQEEAASALPVIDVSAVPGARVAVRRGFTAGDVVVRAACVTAPSDRWAPGLEDLVLGRATGFATASLGVTVERWEPGAIERAAAGFTQTVTGRTGGREVAAVHHDLAFVGPEHEVLLCSVACAAPNAGAGDGACGAVVGQTAVTGPLVGPPPPSALVRAVLFAAAEPYQAGLGAGLACTLAVAVLLLRRPKVPLRRG